MNPIISNKINYVIENGIRGRIILIIIINIFTYGP